MCACERAHIFVIYAFPQISFSFVIPFHLPLSPSPPPSPPPLPFPSRDRKLEMVTDLKEDLEQSRNTIHQLRQEVHISPMCIVPILLTAIHFLVSVPDPKPTPAWILEAIYVPDEVWGRDYTLLHHLFPIVLPFPHSCYLVPISPLVLLSLSFVLETGAS